MTLAELIEDALNNGTVHGAGDVAAAVAEAIWNGCEAAEAIGKLELVVNQRAPWGPEMQQLEAWYTVANAAARMGARLGYALAMLDSGAPVPLAERTHAAEALLARDGCTLLEDLVLELPGIEGLLRAA